MPIAGSRLTATTALQDGHGSPIDQSVLNWDCQSTATRRAARAPHQQAGRLHINISQPRCSSIPPHLTAEASLPDPSPQDSRDAQIHPFQPAFLDMLHRLHQHYVLTSPSPRFADLAHTLEARRAPGDDGMADSFADESTAWMPGGTGSLITMFHSTGGRGCGWAIPLWSGRSTGSKFLRHRDRGEPRACVRGDDMDAACRMGSSFRIRGGAGQAGCRRRGTLALDQLRSSAWPVCRPEPVSAQLSRLDHAASQLSGRSGPDDWPVGALTTSSCGSAYIVAVDDVASDLGHVRRKPNRKSSKDHSAYTWPYIRPSRLAKRRIDPRPDASTSTTSACVRTRR